MSTGIKQIIDGFLLSCKVEGKSYGTIECYSGLPLENRSTLNARLL